MTEHADAVTKNVGQVKSAIAELERMDANPSEQRAKLLKRIVGDVPYWEAAMYTGCADECKAMALNRSILQCKALTSDGEVGGGQYAHLHSYVQPPSVCLRVPVARISDY
eukprot:6603272-Pyramimonas_sp.AAC.1